MTICAIGVGAAALLLFGEFFERIKLNLETVAVKQTGQIAVFKKGYFDFGSGNPGAYGIKNYEEVIRTIQEDASIKDLVNVVTPSIHLFGIAGNFELETSKTFFGIGVVPDDFNKMRKWDEHDLGWPSRWSDPIMSNADETRGIVGVGVARILGLCEKLQLKDCPKLEQKAKDEKKVRDFGDLGTEDLSAKPADEGARLDLLSATASGAPNVVSFIVDKAVPQGAKELDDAFVAMNFSLAQKLLYGREGKSANAVVIQLHRTKDMKFARQALLDLFKSKGWDLEVRDLNELQPFYRQAVGMFSSIFSFIAVIMGVIALFTVVNTMSMSVMERTNEIGTIRALGVKRRGITEQFVVEGALLGVVGSSLGLIFGSFVAILVNHSGLMWLPPGQAEPIPLTVQNYKVGSLLLTIWLGLFAMSVIASFLPAHRAAKMKVVDALGHI